MRWWSSVVLCVAMLRSIPTAAQVPSGANVVVFLPEHRRTVVQGAMRVEFTAANAQVEFRELRTMGDDLAARSSRARTLVDSEAFVVWVEFPSGILAPAELRVQGPLDDAPRFAMLPLAYDLTEPRLIAITASTLFAYQPGPSRVANSPELVADSTTELTANDPASVPQQPAAVVEARAVAIHRHDSLLPRILGDWLVGVDIGLGAHFSHSGGQVAYDGGTFALQGAASVLYRNHGVRLNYAQTLFENGRWNVPGSQAFELPSFRSLLDLRYLSRVWGTPLDPHPRLLGSIGWSLFASIGLYGEFVAINAVRLPRPLDLDSRSPGVSLLGMGAVVGAELAVHFGILKIGADVSLRGGGNCMQPAGYACGSANPEIQLFRDSQHRPNARATPLECFASEQIRTMKCRRSSWIFSRMFVVG